MGAPTKLDEDKTAEMLRLIRNGVPTEVAAQVAGYRSSTLYSWKKRARDAVKLAEGKKNGGVPKADEPFVEFLEAIEGAEAEAEAFYVLKITAAAQGGDAKSAAWWLTHSSSRERWTEKQEMTLKHSGDQVIEVRFADRPPEDAE